VTIKSMPKTAPTPNSTPKTAGPARPAGDPFKFWDDYYRTLKLDEATPDKTFTTVTDLVKTKDYAHAEAAIKGYLHWHGKQAEPWMYEWLVKLIEQRKGSDQELKTTLGFAAFLAKKTRNPNDLVRVADMLVVRHFYGPVGQPGYQTNIGELVDMATEKVPANMIPPMMSMNLAFHDKEPKRMGDAADRLLSLGWPGIDDKVRLEVKDQVKLLEKALRVDGRTEEADALMVRLGESEARDVYVKLSWAGEADFDVSVDEPLGASAGYRNPRTVFGGAIIKNGYGNHTEEVYVCPRAFDGDYTIRVEAIYNDAAKPVTEGTLEVITHEGTAEQKRQLSKVDLAKPAPVVVHLAGGRRKAVLPFIAPIERPPVVAKEKAKPRPTTPPDLARPVGPPAARPVPIR